RYSVQACWPSLSNTMVDAPIPIHVLMLTDDLLPYQNNPSIIEQDQLDLIDIVDRVGDAAKIGAGATRITTIPRELLNARIAAEVMC
ncbi:citrate lyase subunit alpha, partial [Escherichia coli]